MRIDPPASLILAAALLAAPVAAAEAPRTIAVERWQVAGPFAVGSREGFVNHLAGPGGRVPDRFEGDETWPSVLADGGRVGWRTVEPERDAEGRPTGRVQIDLRGANWDARAEEWGAAGVLNAAYAYGEFRLERAGTYLLRADRCSVRLDGVVYNGDPYGAGLAVSVVRARAGTHRVLVRSVGFGGSRTFSVRFEEASAKGPPVRILAGDLLLPDLVEGEAGAGWAGVPVLNVTDRWIKGAVLEVRGKGVHGVAPVEFPLAPRAVLKAPVQLRWSPPGAGGEDLEVEVAVRTPLGGDSAAGRMQVRRPAQSRIETFRSRLDGSAQEYAVLPPAGFRPDGDYGLVVTTHGAGVQCRGQADAHAPKDWAWVLAPTNRRPFGFDWHDWGRLDFEEALDVFRARHPVDPDRISLVGHSMGGHGAWILAVHHADLFACVTPSAGWIGHDTYVPPTLRRSRNFAPPGLSALYGRGVAADRVSLFLENLEHLPVLAVHGTDDDNVPPTHSRLLVGALRDLGYEATLHEVPGAGHWWDRDADRPGADCVDAAFLEDFWKRHRRVRDPSHVVLVTPDPDLSRRAWWVEVEETARTAVLARIEAEATAAGEIRVTTRNVSRFRLEPPARLAPPGRLRVEVDGTALAARLREGGERSVTFERGAGGWKEARRPAASVPVPDGRPGGLRKALFAPFLIVAGTGGGEARQAASLHLARALAASWWRRGDGYAPIVRDADLNDDLRRRFNLVLVGGPDANRETASLSGSLEIVAAGGRVDIEGSLIPGEDLASVHWQPNPRAPERRILVYQATGPSADDLLPLLLPFGSGIGLPDYVVLGPEARLWSWGGFRAAGYWDRRFRYDPREGWRSSPPRASGGR